MALPHIFGTVTAGAQVPGSWLDDNFNAVGLLGAIPCTASGTNAILLTPLTNTPPVQSYQNYTLFSFVAAGGSTGLVTINVSSLGALPLYDITGTAQLGNGSLTAGAIYLIAVNQAFNSGSGGFGVINLGSGGLVNIQYFTAAGAVAYTPTGGATVYFAQVIGGGGGGGGCATTGAGQASIGSAGGSGGYAQKRGLISAISGATITVGAKGAKGAAGNNNGTAGGTSSIGAVVTATGGGAGAGGGAGTPPFGSNSGSSGFGASGDINGSGRQATPGITISSTFLFTASGGDGPYGGAGGSVAVTSGAQAGSNATAYGAGGSGAGITASQTQQAGGDGSAGLVIIWEYR